jgi:large subunit ribosomal protein L32
MGGTGSSRFRSRHFGRQNGHQKEDVIMAVPKRKQSRSNTRSRRSQWKAELPTLVKTVENGKTVYSLPHRAKVVTDSVGTALFMEYKGRKVADV